MEEEKGGGGERGRGGGGGRMRKGIFAWFLFTFLTLFWQTFLFAFDVTNPVVVIFTVTPSVSPMITRCTSIIANIDRTGQKMEKYRFVTDSSEPNSTRVDTMWVNQNDYNFINVEFAAIFTAPEIPTRPEYIENFKFGIVSGKINIGLHKVDRNGTCNILNIELPCLILIYLT